MQGLLIHRWQSVKVERQASDRTNENYSGGPRLGWAPSLCQKQCTGSHKPPLHSTAIAEG